MFGLYLLSDSSCARFRRLDKLSRLGFRSFAGFIQFCLQQSHSLDTVADFGTSFTTVRQRSCMLRKFEESCMLQEDMGKQKQELPSDPSQYTILKEGQADILMHGNDVFYNKTQVVNRDLSIAVLRTFVAKCKEEYAEMCAKKKGRKMSASSTQAAPELVACDSYEPGASTPAVDDVIGEPATVVNTAHLEKDNGVKIFSNGAAQSEVTDKVHEVSDERANPVIKRVREEPRPLRILEALAASGLRALRYAREVEGVGSVVAVDNNKVAVEACKRNIKLNGSVACSKVEAQLADAKVYMLTHEKEFDVVDLDPYGSPSVFLDSAVQSVVDGGMLMCTATDMAVLCGKNGEVCYSKYGSYPTRAEYCHEMALRILLASIESHANRYKRYIVPVLSVKVDFYIRVFVRIFTSANAMKNTPLKLSYIYQCVGCDSFHLQPLARTANKNNSLRYLPGCGPVVPQECSDCGKKFNMGGPIWSAPIHDPDWVSSILSNVTSLKSCYPAYDRIYAIMTSVSEELLDVPLFLCQHNICGTLKCTSIGANMLRSAIVNAGYRVSGTHTAPLGLKTDAPMDVVWDIMRCWVQLHPVKSQPSDQSGSIILAKEPTLKANFTQAQAALSHAQCKKVPRFLPNPESYWGPKPRAGRQITSKHTSLLGPEFINNLTSQRDSEMSEAKRQKLDEANCKEDI